MQSGTGATTPPPRLVITPGEPAGIGPDITLATAQQPLNGALVAVADAQMLEARARSLQLELELHVQQPGEPLPRHRPGRLCVWHVPLATEAEAGRLDPDNARGVLAALDVAVAACLDGHAEAMVTGPVQKSVINDAGIPFSGHTEYLAERTGSGRVVMMLAIPGLRVALATTHLPLAEVAGAITAPLLRETLHILHDDLRRKFGLGAPRIDAGDHALAAELLGNISDQLRPRNSRTVHRYLVCAR